MWRIKKSARGGACGAEYVVGSKDEKILRVEVVVVDDQFAGLYGIDHLLEDAQVRRSGAQAPQHFLGLADEFDRFGCFAELPIEASGRLGAAVPVSH